MIDIKRFPSSTILSLALALLVALTSAQASATASNPPPILIPDREHQKTLFHLVKVLRIEHYNKIDINDQMSSDMFDSYLDLLDKNRLYFLASDIEEFEKYRYQLDDSLSVADLSFAYLVFNRYQLRSQQRMEHLLARLDEGLDSLDFKKDETIPIDRSSFPWAKTTEELDEAWRKQLKSTILNLKLADKETDKIADTLKKRYTTQLHRIDQINSDDVFQTYANALTALYGPHTQYFSPRRSENFNIDMKLSLEGIGAVLQSEYESTKIVRLIPGGPASKTGQLKPTDTITGVAQGEDGEMVDVIGWRLDEVVDLIRGPKDSTVRLQVVSGDSKSKAPKVISIIRNTVKLEEQAAQKHLFELERDGKQRKIGVISIPTFYIDFDAYRQGDPDYRSTTRDTKKLMDELIAEGAEGLVIDLRNNGGGSLTEAIQMAGLFIPQGPVVQVKDSLGFMHPEYDRDPTYYDIPLAVMVNRLSASASEIFAGAIKDYNRGLIVGSQTFGKGTVQVLQELPAGQVKLTRAKFYRVSGDSTQNKGVTPDLLLPSLLDPEEIGESTAKGALPWDQVKPLPRQNMASFDRLLDQITLAHEQRLKADPEFGLIEERREWLKNKREMTSLPLNEEKLKAQLDEDEQWRLALENRRRKSLQLPPIESLDELAAEQAEADPNVIELDAALKEGSQVLLDLIQAGKQQVAKH